MVELGRDDRYRIKKGGLTATCVNQLVLARCARAKRLTRKAHVDPPSLQALLVCTAHSV